MEVERKRSKGGFFQLFDWNGKSRKKSFTGNSELSGSKQVKENIKSLPMPGQHHFPEADIVVSSSIRCGSDYNYASSVVSDEGSGSRAPGVVARLMGLDSLPTSNIPEPCSSSSPFPDYHSHRASPCEYPMEYINFPDKLQSLCSNPEESRLLHKVQNRPIERFQTEILPPRSAKSIPITHHKLLSPIKGPGFVPTKNAAYIMEAAAKIIEERPQTATTGKISCIGSSSVPLRILDLKEKMEAAQKTTRPQRPKEPTVRVPVSLETHNPESSKNKGKSVSLASQEKVNIRRKEGSISRTRSLTNQKEQNEFKSNPNLKRNTTNRSNNVLKQNNLKQNCASNKDRLMSKTSASKKPIPTNRTVSKVFISSEAGSRKMEPMENAAEKKPSSAKTKNFPRKGYVKSDNNQVQYGVANHSLTSKDKGSNAVSECKNWDAGSSENDMNVVSFTFTSPLRRSMMEEKNSVGVDSLDDSDRSYSDHSESSSPRLNVIGSDTLSLLLDQKLRELAHRVESSHSKSRTSSSTSSLQDSVSTINVISSTSSEHEKKFQLPYSFYGCDCPSIDDPAVRVDEKWQGLKGLEEFSMSRNCSESGKELARRRPTSISNFESSAGESDRWERKGDSSKSCKSSLLLHTREFEGDTEPSNSVSSLSAMDLGREVSVFRLTRAKRPVNWESQYLRNILNSELRLKDFLSGQANDLISPNLFDQLENQATEMGTHEECSKLGRKLFFDCALECLHSPCRSLVAGNHKSHATLESLISDKGRLADQLYEEISGLKNMGDMMVDELVDSDMSKKYGRWVEFNDEVFEESVKIEKAILSSLVDELVIDFMF